MFYSVLSMNRHKHLNPSPRFYGPITKDLNEIESVLSDLERLRNLAQCEKRDVLIERCERFLNPEKEKSTHNEILLRYENLQRYVRDVLTKTQSRQRTIAVRSTDIIRNNLGSLLRSRKININLDDRFFLELDQVILSALHEAFKTSDLEELESFDSAMDPESYFVSQTQNIEFL